MADVIAGSVVYPNLPPVIAATYTCSHGISPGVLLVRTHVGNYPDGFGTAVITDGTKALAITNCKLNRFSVDKTDAGTEWVFEFLDRRWRWKDLCGIDGCYNQLDPHGKLIPRFVQSPTELAVLCLAAMGMSKYTIDLPPGVTSAMAKGIPGFLDVGIVFPQIGINPAVNWYQENPAVALARLCDDCGRKLVYNVATDSVHIVRPGTGSILPAGSVRYNVPGLDMPQSPDFVKVVGDPTRHQGLWELAPYGEEWDGSIRPIDQLSYAPVIDPDGLGKKFQVRIKVGTVKEGSEFFIYVTPPDPPNTKGQVYSYKYVALSTDDAPAVATALALLLTNNADKFLQGKVTAVATNNVVEVEFTEPGKRHDVKVRNLGLEVMRPPVPANGGKPLKGWQHSPPPLFPGIQATPRLTVLQARQLAQRSVFRMYRLTGRDVRGRGPMIVPGYGPVRREQVILLDTQCEQVVPAKGEEKLLVQNLNLGNQPKPVPLDPFILDLYHGYSRDKPARVYGSVARHIVQATGLSFVGDGQNAADVNTDSDLVVPIDFSVDPAWQMIVFGTFVYANGQGQVVAYPKLKLQCAVNVRDAATNQLAYYHQSVTIRPGTAGWVVHKPDVQLNVIGEYNQLDQLTGVRVLEADPLVRTKYYLEGAVLQLYAKGSDTTHYNGLVIPAMTASVTQVTWRVQGGEGIDTIVSRNHEHDTHVLPFPARRRAENLRPVVNELQGGAAARINPAMGSQGTGRPPV